MARAAAWSTANTIVLRIGGMAVNIALARMLAPQAFGVFAVAITVQMLLLPITDLGTVADLVRNGDIPHRGPVVATIGFGSGCGLALFMAVTAPFVAKSMGAPQAAPVIQVMSLTLVLAGFSIVPAAVIQREFMQTRQFVFDATALLLSTLVTFSLIAADWGPMSLAIGRIAGQATVTLLSYASLRMLPRFGFDKVLAKQILAFSLPIAGANLVSWLVLTVDSIIVGYMLGATVLALYTIAFNVSSWPMTALGQVVRSVSLPAFARIASSAARLESGLREAAQIVWSIATPLGFGLAMLADSVIRLLYGEAWAGAVVALSALGIFGASRVVFELYATLLYARGSSRIVMGIQLLWFVALVPAMVVGVRGWGLAGAAWAHVAVSIFVVLPCYILALRRNEASPAAALSGSLASVVASAAAAVATYLVTGRVEGPMAQLALGGVTFALVYGVLVYPSLSRGVLAGRIRDRLARREPELTS